MITLHLYGVLAKEFGDTVKLDAKTPREAVTALSYQSEKYREEIITNNWHVLVGKDNDISEEELDISLGNVTEVFLVPAIGGAGSGNAKIAWGALITIVGVVLLFTPLAPVGVGLIGAGAGILAAGIVQNSIKDPDPAASADSNASFLFTGPSNSSNQGVAIPRGYGRLLVGSTVISAAITAEETV